MDLYTAGLEIHNIPREQWLIKKGGNTDLKLVVFFPVRSRISNVLFATFSITLKWKVIFESLEKTFC